MPPLSGIPGDNSTAIVYFMLKCNRLCCNVCCQAFVNLNIQLYDVRKLNFQANLCELFAEDKSNAVMET